MERKVLDRVVHWAAKSTLARDLALKKATQTARGESERTWLRALLRTPNTHTTEEGGMACKILPLLA